MAQIALLRTSRFQPSRMLHALRGFSTSASSSGPDSTSGTQEKKTDSILDFNQANEHCKNSVKKFDFYSYRVATHLPVSQHPYYYAIHAFFIEVMRSREISKERSIC